MDQSDRGDRGDRGKNTPQNILSLGKFIISNVFEFDPGHPGHPVTLDQSDQKVMI